MLVEHFLQVICTEQGIAPKKFDETAIELLKNYPWPVNIRELRNIVERLIILCGTVITADDVNMYM